MLINPWLEMTAMVEGRLESTCIKAGPDENGMGGSGRMVRRS